MKAIEQVGFRAVARAWREQADRLDAKWAEGGTHEVQNAACASMKNADWRVGQQLRKCADEIEGLAS